MGRLSAEDWEHVIDRDLLPLLGIGIGRKPQGAQFPADSAWLPDGAYEDLSVGVGRLGVEDILVVPPTAWQVTGCGTAACTCRCRSRESGSGR